MVFDNQYINLNLSSSIVVTKLKELLGAQKYQKFKSFILNEKYDKLSFGIFIQYIIMYHLSWTFKLIILFLTLRLSVQTTLNLNNIKNTWRINKMKLIFIHLLGNFFEICWQLVSKRIFKISIILDTLVKMQITVYSMQ